MQYRKNPKNNDKISALGLGCMRFPRKGGKIDQHAANQLVATAIDSGVNLFDTAYIYPGSEDSLGIALNECGKRDEINISTKLPHFRCKKTEDFDKYFDTQLKRLKTDYIDYYFVHMLTNISEWQRLCDIGIKEWLEQKKREGKIRNIGFSFHGGEHSFVELINAYDWEFCMVQYNYLDEHTQAGRGGVKAAHAKGLPVFAMEPLRGGSLVDGLPEKAKEIFNKANNSRSYAEWGIKWLLNQPEITMVLSGMSSISQLEENIKISKNALPNELTKEDLEIYDKVVAAINHAVKVPCTLCQYCIDCPQGVNIPTCFTYYNESYSVGLRHGMEQYFMCTGMLSSTPSDASRCTKCKKCEKLCPQGIKIVEELAKVKKRMRLVKTIAAIVKKFSAI